MTHVERACVTMESVHSPLHNIPPVPVSQLSVHVYSTNTATPNIIDRVSVCHRSLRRNSSPSLYQHGDSQLFISPVPLLCHPMPAPLLPCSPNINLQTRHLRKIPPFAQLHPPQPSPPTSAPSTVLPNEGRNIFAAWAVQISRVGKKFVQWGTPGSLWLLCLTPQGCPCRITVASSQTFKAQTYYLLTFC